jgi:hypothetical protein
MKIILYLLTFVFLTHNLTLGQTIDSMPSIENEQTISNLTTETDDFEDVDDFAPGLFLFAVLGFAFILISAGAGIVLTILALLILFALIGAGIFSASILVGLNKKSFTKGFKTFLVSTTTIGGLFVGLAGAWIFNNSTHGSTLQASLIAGSIIGLLAGLSFGLFAFYAIQKLTTYLKTKFNND